MTLNRGAQTLTTHRLVTLGSDFAIFAACTAFALVLGSLALRRRRAPFRRLLGLGCAFLLACGLTSLVNVFDSVNYSEFWEMGTRLGTALIAWVTLCILIPLLPRLRSLRSPSELEEEVARRVQELSNSEARIRALVETAADGILTVDSQGRIRSANRACRGLFALPPELMIDRPVSDFLVSPLLADDCFPDEFSSDSDRPRRPREDALGLRPDGRTFPVSLSISRTQTPSGRLLTLIVHDLTEFNRTEEALRLSEARLRMVLNQVPAILCSTDGRLRIRLLTCSVGTGMSTLGMHLPRFLGVSLLDRFEAPRFLPIEAFTRALQGESVTAEMSWEDRIFEFHIEPLRDDQRIVGTVGVGLDVTERKKEEKAQEFYSAQLRERNEQLLRSNRELDEFAYIASHDLREPLRGISNYATFLLEDYGKQLDREGVSRLETLKRLAERMDALIASLLEFSRVGRVDLAVEQTDLNAVVDEVLASLQITLEMEDIEVRFSHNLPTLRCDRVRIAEVFRNLITNALKYNDKEHKWVEIGMLPTGPDSSEQPFYVRDNGIGIPQQHWDSIFRIFRRLHGRDKYGGGTGVGLTIVKKIIERHGGRVWLDSTPGEGTTFYFVIGEKIASSSSVIR